MLTLVMDIQKEKRLNREALRNWKNESHLYRQRKELQPEKNSFPEA